MAGGTPARGGAAVWTGSHIDGRRSSVYSAAVTPGDDERALVRAAATGDQDAFADLVRRHEGRVRATCGRILANDPASTDDCVQDTFTQAWRALARFDGRALFGTWLYRIASNEALQALRRRQPHELLVDEMPLSTRAQTPGPGIERIDRERVRATVRSRLLELPESLRVPVVLRDIEEWSNEDIAAALELSLPAAKARIHRGRMRLRELLAADFPERR